MVIAFLPSNMMEEPGVAEREKREVLILDEEPSTLMDLFDRIYEEGFEATGVSTPAEAVRWVTRKHPDLLIDHLRGADPGEMDLIEKIKRLSPRTHIILMGDREARPSGLETLKDRHFEWVPEDPADSTLIEALHRATASAQERPDRTAGFNEPKDQNARKEPYHVDLSEGTRQDSGSYGKRQARPGGL